MSKDQTKLPNGVRKPTNDSLGKSVKKPDAQNLVDRIKAQQANNGGQSSSTSGSWTFTIIPRANSTYT